MEQLQKAIGNPPYLAISLDACKALENGIKKVYPWAKHRECLFHLMKNFVKRFQGPAFGRMYLAARTFQPDYHEYLMNKIYAANAKVKPWLEKNHKLMWMRSKFLEEIKCDRITNNVAKVWNMWVKDIKDLPIANLADTLRSKIMGLIHIWLASLLQCIMPS
jgi:transposase-like protein